MEKLLRQGRYKGIEDILAGLPAFVYSHYGKLEESWDKITLEDMMKDEEGTVESTPTDYESLPDTNLLKQYWLKYKAEFKKKEDGQ